MKELPILFNTDMVQAIKADRKTMTRRTRNLKEINKRPDDWRYVTDFENNRGELFACFENKKTGKWLQIFCPYGNVGDKIWVRETWCDYGNSHAVEELNYDGHYLYRADGDFVNAKIWKPSIHMPQKAARIWLQVTGIRVERLQDISEEDAIAEGITITHPFEGITYYKNYGEGNKRRDFLEGSTYAYNLGAETHTAPIASFCTLIQSINGAEVWDANHWVWVVSFKVLSITGQPERGITINKQN